MLESMTVTAEKREKRIRDIAGSVSALNDVQIEDGGINAITDIHKYVPNFKTYPIYGANGHQSIRGQSNLVFSSPAVGIYIDDVPSTFGFTGVLTSLFDLERIEVLRGPQGNLYGMNSAMILIHGLFPAMMNSRLKTGDSKKGTISPIIPTPSGSGTIPPGLT